MKKILVTGANGFIGKEVLQALSTGDWEIHATTTKVVPSEKKGVRWHTVDLLTPQAPEKIIQTVRPTHLLHLAWYNVPGLYWESTENSKWKAASTSLYTAFTKQGGTRFVAAGTCAEYAWTSDRLAEHTGSLFPETFYGRCKLATQVGLENFSKKEGLSSAWGRIFFPYGPGQDMSRLIPSLIQAFLEEREAVCRSGQLVRDFIYSSDVAEAFVKLLECDVQGPVNIGTGKGVLLSDVAVYIADKFKKRNLLSLPESLSNDAKTVIADCTKLSSLVGFTPEISLFEGLDRMIEGTKASPIP